MNPESTGIPAKPAHVEPTANPITPAKAPASGAKMGRPSESDRVLPQQHPRNYDPGLYARASREHGRGRHGR